jgi:hypothetical protein
VAKNKTLIQHRITTRLDQGKKQRDGEAEEREPTREEPE